MAVTVLTERGASLVSGAVREGDAVWIPIDDLPASTGWELKPEGVCRDELCIPLPDDRAGSLVTERDGVTGLDMSGFARYAGLETAHDAATETWYFGPGPAARSATLERLEAPDFELPDLGGRQHRLSDHRGTKVLLALWASW